MVSSSPVAETVFSHHSVQSLPHDFSANQQCTSSDNVWWPSSVDQTSAHPSESFDVLSVNGAYDHILVFFFLSLLFMLELPDVKEVVDDAHPSSLPPAQPVTVQHSESACQHLVTDLFLCLSLPHIYVGMYFHCRGCP